MRWSAALRPAGDRASKPSPEGGRFSRAVVERRQAHGGKSSSEAEGEELSSGMKGSNGTAEKEADSQRIQDLQGTAMDELRQEAEQRDTNRRSGTSG